MIIPTNRVLFYETIQSNKISYQIERNQIAIVLMMAKWKSYVKYA